MKHVVSTHLLRRTARRAERHYKGLIAAAYGMNVPAAQFACRALGLREESRLKVERAVHERAKWRVVAE